MSNENERKCRVCGCTEMRACILCDDDGDILGTCTWEEEDLCEACAKGACPLWIHPDDPDYPGEVRK